MAMASVDWGDDEEAMDIRKGMPEPAHYALNVWIEPVCNPLSDWEYRKGVDKIERALYFYKILVHDDGVSYYAWECDKDGKIY